MSWGYARARARIRASQLWKFFYACTQTRTFRAGGTLFCNSRLLNFAKDELSDHDSENCSNNRRVTWFIICPKILTFLTLMFFTPPSAPLSCPGIFASILRYLGLSRFKGQNINIRLVNFPTLVLLSF